MKRAIFLFAIMLNHLVLAAQSEQPDKEIAVLIAEREFEFVAESALPLRGRMIFLSGNYNFVVRPDSIKSNLPYYGRAYQAPTDLSGGGIDFISTDFDYNVKESKKRWTIAIRPKDSSDATQIYLSISRNGQASLRVTSINRQSISFHGYIRKILSK